jgi:hypothetical protein
VKYDLLIVVRDALGPVLDPAAYRLLLGGQDLTARPGLAWDGERLFVWDREESVGGLPRLDGFLPRGGSVPVFAALAEAARDELCRRRFRLGGERVWFGPPGADSPAARWQPWLLLMHRDDEPADEPAALDEAPPDEVVNLFVAPLSFQLDGRAQGNLLRQAVEDPVLAERACVLPPRPCPPVGASDLAVGATGRAVRSALVRAGEASACRPAGLDVLSIAAHPFVHDAIIEGAHLGFAVRSPDRPRRLQLVSAPDPRFAPVQDYRVRSVLDAPEPGYWQSEVWRAVRADIAGVFDEEPDRVTETLEGDPTAFPVELFGPGADQRLGELDRCRALDRLGQQAANEPGSPELPENDPFHQARRRLPHVLALRERTWRERDPDTAALFLELDLPEPARAVVASLAATTAHDPDAGLGLVALAFWPALWPFATAEEPSPLGVAPTFRAFAVALRELLTAADPGAWVSACRDFCRGSALVRESAEFADDVVYHPPTAEWARAGPLLHLLCPLSVAVVPGVWAAGPDEVPAVHAPEAVWVVPEDGPGFLLP